MTPTITFRHPDDLFAVVYIVAVPAPGVSETAIRISITKKRRRFIRNECAWLAGRIDFDHSIDLMTALIVFKSECATVFAPDRIRQFVGIRKECVIDAD